MNCKNWEVGSTWYVKPVELIIRDGIDKCVNSRYPNITFFSTCRSAICEILSECADIKRALVPAFTCHSVIEPFLRYGVDIHAYQINTNLTIDQDDFLKLVNAFDPQIILIHGYFGIDTTKDDNGIIKKLMQKGIIIVEDTTQTMFSDYTHIPSTYKLGSLRKWFPIPDGAFITNISKVELAEDKELSEAKWNAMVLKGKYIFEGIGRKDEFMPLFKNAESLLDSRKHTAGMSKVSYALFSRYDISEIKQMRRANYQILSKRLKKHPEIKLIKEDLDCNETPFLLPVYIETIRGEFQDFLASHNVYPTIIWSVPHELHGKLNEDTKYIYDNILCFHIDQRYEQEDMDKVADIVDLYFKNKHEE